MKIFDKILSRIKHIQSQPESVKSRYIWTLTIAVFAGIVAVWLVFSKITAPRIASNANEPAINAKNNLNDLKEKIKSGFSEVKNNALPELKNLLKNEEKAGAKNDNSSNTVDKNLK